jgi:hypothetical protein
MVFHVGALGMEVMCFGGRDGMSGGVDSPLLISPSCWFERSRMSESIAHEKAKKKITMPSVQTKVPHAHLVRVSLLHNNSRWWNGRRQSRTMTARGQQGSIRVLTWACDSCCPA